MSLHAGAATPTSLLLPQSTAFSILGHQVTVNGSDGGGTVTQTVDGSTLSATFAVSDIPDWAIQVRAHNAAGRESVLGGV